jgi:hypothetical protein
MFLIFTLLSAKGYNNAMQNLGLLSFLLLGAGLTFTVTKWPGGLHMTFSQHAAVSRWSKVFYSLLFMIVLPVLFLFFAMWFVPAKGLPGAFLWIAAISVLFQIACTWIPEEGGRKTIIHRLLTSVSGVALLPLIVIIATSSNLSTLVRYTAWVALIAMVALLMVALGNQKGFRYALLLQVGYYAAFIGVILLVTYI